MTDPRHARILANIAAQVAQQYTLTRSGSTSDPDEGNVPVPVVDDPRGLPLGHPSPAHIVHGSWSYTLPEEYQA